MRSDGRPLAGRRRRSLTLRFQPVRQSYAVVLGGERGARSLDEGLGRPTPATLIALPRWRPRADVAETARSIVITVELAGVDPGQIEAVLYEDALVVSGRRRLAGPGAGGVYHAAEINQGPFHQHGGS